MEFMILIGLGMYIPYVAFHTTVFERMLAVFRETGTIGYLMYLADAFGYLGYLGIIIFRNTASIEIRYLELLTWVSVVIAVISTLFACMLMIYYRRVFQQLGSNIVIERK